MYLPLLEQIILHAFHTCMTWGWDRQLAELKSKVTKLSTIYKKISSFKQRHPSPQSLTDRKVHNVSLILGLIETFESALWSPKSTQLSFSPGRKGGGARGRPHIFQTGVCPEGFLNLGPMMNYTNIDAQFKVQTQNVARSSKQRLFIHSLQNMELSSRQLQNTKFLKSLSTLDPQVTLSSACITLYLV